MKQRARARLGQWQQVSAFVAGANGNISAGAKPALPMTGLFASTVAGRGAAQAEQAERCHGGFAFT